MTKVAFIANSDSTTLVNNINDFIKDKKVIDIKYQSVLGYTKFNASAIPLDLAIYDRVLIVYEVR